MYRHVNSDVLVIRFLVVLVLLALGKLVPGTCWLVGFSGIFVGPTSSGPWLSKAKNISQLSTESVTWSVAQFTGF